MSRAIQRWLADENFPIPAFRLLADAGWDIRRIGVDQGGLPDTAVMQRAIDEERLLITFDDDHGTLVFKEGYRPAGVVYFRLDDYLPDAPGRMLINLFAEDWPFVGYITVVENDVIRQRAIPSR